MTTDSPKLIGWIMRAVSSTLGMFWRVRFCDRGLLRELGAIGSPCMGEADAGQRIEYCSRAVNRVLEASTYRHVLRPGLNAYMAGIAAGVYGLASVIAVGLRGALPDVSEEEAAQWSMETLEAIYRLGYQQGRRLRTT